jgi:hypothetical protein
MQAWLRVKALQKNQLRRYLQKEPLPRLLEVLKEARQPT